MGKGKKHKKLPKADRRPDDFDGEIQDPFCTAFVGIWRNVDPDTGEMWNSVRAHGEGGVGLPDYTLAMGMLNVASVTLIEAYEEHYAGHDDEEY